MIGASESIRCTKPECGISTSGLCADGHEPTDACPFLVRSSDEGQNEDPGAANLGGEETAEENQIQLPSGEALDVQTVDEFLRWRPATFVTIVGERASGKTTLICAIYDRFLRGPFGGLVFAGSRTLISLERRSHLSRAESGASQPDTPHTSLAEGLRFFHFAVARADRMDVRTDLMLSDRAGERYREARGKSDVVPSLVEVVKADVLVLLLDGGRIADPVERAEGMQSVRQTLRAFLDGGGLTTESLVQVVTTKLDLLACHPERDQLERYLSSFKQGLDSDFAPRLANLSFWEIAARDPKGTLEPAFGVDKLLASWVSLRRRAGIGLFRSSVVLENEFERLLLRTPMEIVP